MSATSLGQNLTETDAAAVPQPGDGDPGAYGALDFRVLQGAADLVVDVVGWEHRLSGPAHGSRLTGGGGGRHAPHAIHRVVTRRSRAGDLRACCLRYLGSGSGPRVGGWRVRGQWECRLRQWI